MHMKLSSAALAGLAWLLLLLPARAAAAVPAVDTAAIDCAHTAVARWDRVVHPANVRPATPLSGTQALAYPADARRYGLSGVALLDLVIDAAGTVQSVSVEDTSGTELLDNAAVTSAQSWRYAPARCGGTPIAESTQRRVRWDLKDGGTAPRPTNGLAGAYLQTANVYILKEWPKTAIAILTNLLALDGLSRPAADGAHLMRALAHTRQRNLQAALADIDAVRQHASDDPMLLLMRSQIDLVGSDGTAALADIDAALAKSPDLPAAHFLRGNLRLRSADYAGALADYAVVRTAEPKNAYVLTLCALARRKLGQVKQADDDITKAQSLGDDQAFEFYQSHPLDLAPPPSAKPEPGLLSVVDHSPEGVTAPTPANAHHSSPYPGLSHRTGNEGVATVEFTIAVDGKVRDPAILKSSGFADIDAAAVAAVRDWRYHPATQNGKPIAVRDAAKLGFWQR